MLYRGRPGQHERARVGETRAKSGRFEDCTAHDMPAGQTPKHACSPVLHPRPPTASRFIRSGALESTPRLPHPPSNPLPRPCLSPAGHAAEGLMSSC